MLLTCMTSYDILLANKKKTMKRLIVLAPAIDPSAQEAEPGRPLEFEGSLVDGESSRQSPFRATSESLPQKAN